MKITKKVMAALLGVFFLPASDGRAVKHMDAAFMDYDHLHDFYQDLKDLETGKRTDGHMLVKDYENLSKNTYWYKGSPEKMSYLLGEISELVQIFKEHGCDGDYKKRLEAFSDAKPIDVSNLTFKKQREPKAHHHHKKHAASKHGKKRHKK